jgi:hypothetical protein
MWDGRRRLSPHRQSPPLLELRRVVHTFDFGLDFKSA